MEPWAEKGSIKYKVIAELQDQSPFALQKHLHSNFSSGDFTLGVPGEIPHEAAEPVKDTRPYFFFFPRTNVAEKNDY